MKITNISDPKGFFEMLKQCTGNIELVTEDGDRLNLKSKLCQYIAMTDIFSNAEIGEMEILFSNTHDAALVVNFLVRG